MASFSDFLACLLRIKKTIPLYIFLSFQPKKTRKIETITIMITLKFNIF